MDSGNPAPPFLNKTYDMVDDPSTDSVVSWSSGNNSFVIWNLPEFQRDLLPKFFKHNNYSSFVRQLNTYGFRKVVQDRHEFANEDFLRGQKHLLKNISRKKTTHAHANQPAQAQSSPVAACVEVGKFGFDEEIEMLKRDKNVLMQELVRLRQQQQTTDHQLHSMGQRVQVMEQRQQQMMSFLAKAMQSPGFLSQLVHQQNETSQHVVGGTKKRRLPRQEEEDLAGDDGNNVVNGQIVKFHSSMNEAAKAMLQQIMKMNSSARLDPSMTDLVPFLIGDVPSSSALDSGNSTSRISGLTLSEVSPASTQPFLPNESGVPVSDPSAVFSEVQSAPFSEVQSAPCAVADPIKASHINGINVLSCEQDPVLSNFNEMQGVGPENSLGSLNIDMATFENGNDRVSSGLNVTIPVEMDVFSPNSGLDLTIPVELDPFSTNSGLNVSIPVEMDASSPKQDVEVFVDAIPKLPSINDVFWEQFLTAGSLTEETDGFNSSSPESDITNGNQSWKENGWDKLQHMNKLAEQMELLASETCEVEVPPTVYKSLAVKR